MYGPLLIDLLQLGPSALAGFALFLILAPLQERAMAQQFQIRKKSMKYTDQRAKTLLEVLGMITSLSCCNTLSTWFT
jgi:ATP-binding cassette subfamily C (CFTR/MRP) protein 1